MAALVPFFCARLANKSPPFASFATTPVGNDNCVSFEGVSLQIPADEHRYHYVRAQVRVHRYVDGTLALFHGPRKLAAYDACGTHIKEREDQLLAA